MEDQKNSQIDKIAKVIGLDTMTILPYAEKFGLTSFGSFEQALSQSTVGFFEWSVGGKHVYISDLVYAYTGLDKDYRGTFINMLKNTIVPDALLEFLTHIATRMTRVNQSSAYEIEIFSRIHKDFRWFIIKSEIIFDPNQDAYTILGTINDITHQKNAAEELLESQDVLKNVLNTIPLPIIYADKNDNIQFINATSHQFFSGIFEHAHSEDLTTLVQDGYVSFKKKFYQAIHIQREKNLIEENFRNKYRLDVTYDNQHKNIIIDDLDMYSQTNKYLGKVVAFTDITEQIDSKVQLRKLLKANELSIEIKDTIDKADNLTNVYQLILKQIHEIIPNAITGCVLEVDDQNYLKIAASEGYNEEYAKGFSIPFEESYAFENLKGNYNRSVIVRDVRIKYKEIFPEVKNNDRGFDINSNITAPISVNGKLYGILSIDSDKIDAFDEVDLNLIDYLRIQIERTINRHNKYLTAMEDSRVDPLTKAYNRRFLIKAYDNFAQRAEWQQEEFALVVFDLDGLKAINDNYGHLTGDKAITQFSSLVLSKIRATDIFARYGGDEFVCLFFKGMTDSIIGKIESWQNYLNKRPIEINGEQIHTRFSYGFACYPNDGKDFKTLMATADKRMYHAKNLKKFPNGDGS